VKNAFTRGSESSQTETRIGILVLIKMLYIPLGFWIKISNSFSRLFGPETAWILIQIRIYTNSVSGSATNDEDL
jgi:hypothetical protein